VFPYRSRRDWTIEDRVGDRWQFSESMRDVAREELGPETVLPATTPEHLSTRKRVVHYIDVVKALGRKVKRYRAGDLSIRGCCGIDGSRVLAGPS
jgi:hypothetical protein